MTAPVEGSGALPGMDGARGEAEPVGGRVVGFGFAVSFMC